MEKPVSNAVFPVGGRKRKHWVHPTTHGWIDDLPGPAIRIRSPEEAKAAGGLSQAIACPQTSATAMLSGGQA